MGYWLGGVRECGGTASLRTGSRDHLYESQIISIISLGYCLSGGHSAPPTVSRDQFYKLQISIIFLGYWLGDGCGGCRANFCSSIGERCTFKMVLRSSTDKETLSKELNTAMPDEESLKGLHY